jgi:hypothetical protein
MSHLDKNPARSTSPLLTAAAAVLGLTACTAEGALISEYFNYGDTTTALYGASTGADGLNGGSGWASGWRRPGDGGASDYPDYIAGANLTVTKTGYSNEGNLSTGGLLGQAANMTRSDRHVHRLVNAMDGTIWMSALVRFVENSRPVTFGFDGAVNSPLNRVQVHNNTMTPTYNSVTQTGAASGIGQNNTALVVFRITVDADGDFDRIEGWSNPSDVSSIASLGTPTINTGATADVFGSSITVFSFAAARNSTDGSRIDAIRISDETNAFQFVMTGVPEPATTSLLGVAGLALLRRRAT